VLSAAQPEAYFSLDSNQSFPLLHGQGNIAWDSQPPLFNLLTATATRRLREQRQQGGWVTDTQPARMD